MRDVVRSWSKPQNLQPSVLHSPHLCRISFTSSRERTYTHNSHTTAHHQRHTIQLGRTKRLSLTRHFNMASQSLPTMDDPTLDTGPSLIPDLPPNLSLTLGKTVDEVLADLNKHPLFMTNLEENDDVAALQALAYDGTPLENATNFKDQGNECFKGKAFADAKEFYSKGIAVIVTEERRRARGEPSKDTGTHEGSSDEPEEVEREKKILETMYVNRAAANLELGNFRMAVGDCGLALRLNPKNVKAWYRSARALLRLGKVEEADEACAKGLAVEPENKALRELAGEIVSRARELAEKKRKEEQRESKNRREEMVLKTALKARGIRTRSTDQPPEMEDAGIKMVPDPADPESTLVFPTVLLYPVHLESDFIKAFGEGESLEQHFKYVFPLPWDKEGVYSINGVECYVETVSGGLMKVGKKVPLLKVLAGGIVEVVDEVVKVFVVPKARAEGWVKEFKEKRATEGK